MKVEALIRNGIPLSKCVFAEWAEELGSTIKQTPVLWPGSEEKAISLYFKTTDRFEAIAGGGLLERKIQDSQPDKEYQVLVDGIPLREYATQCRSKIATRRR